MRGPQRDPANLGKVRCAQVFPKDAGTKGGDHGQESSTCYAEPAAQSGT
jgi:hypothetical protein